jgi:hypothetical protein
MKIPFVLSHTDSNQSQEFIGAEAPPSLAQDMLARWARFVKGGAMPDWANAKQRLRIFN